MQLKQVTLEKCSNQIATKFLLLVSALDDGD